MSRRVCGATVVLHALLDLVSLLLSRAAPPDSGFKANTRQRAPIALCLIAHIATRNLPAQALSLADAGQFSLAN